jgi:hypothetical protein
MTGYLARLKANIGLPADKPAFVGFVADQDRHFQDQKSPTERTDKTDKALHATLPAGLAAALAAIRRDPNAFYRFEGIVHPSPECEISLGNLLGLLARLHKHGIRLSIEDGRLCWWADVPRLPPLPLIDELEAARATIVEALQARAASLV